MTVRASLTLGAGAPFVTLGWDGVALAHCWRGVELDELIVALTAARALIAADGDELRHRPETVDLPVERRAEVMA